MRNRTIKHRCRTVHLNCIPVTLVKGNDKKVLCLFGDNIARDMSNGFGELVNYKETYQKLIADGYKDTRN